MAYQWQAYVTNIADKILADEIRWHGVISANGMAASIWRGVESSVSSAAKISMAKQHGSSEETALARVINGEKYRKQRSS